MTSDDTVRGGPCAAGGGEGKTAAPASEWTGEWGFMHLAEADRRAWISAVFFLFFTERGVFTVSHLQQLTRHRKTTSLYYRHGEPSRDEAFSSPTPQDSEHYYSDMRRPRNIYTYRYFHLAAASIYCSLFKPTLIKCNDSNS